MISWLRSIGSLTLESMPLCGVITLLNPTLILLGASVHAFGIESWFILGVLFLISSLTLGAMLSLAPMRWRSWIISGLRALFALSFLITIFYPKGGHRLDGFITEQPSVFTLATLYGAYLLVFLVLLFTIRRYKQTLHRAYLIVLLVCIATVGYGIYGSSKEVWAVSQKLVNSKAPELNYGTEKNVIFILADMLQGSTIEQYFSVNNESIQQFEGFTAFTRATSPFPFTYYALPALLSGRLYASREDKDWRENLKAAQRDSFITDALKKGYDISVVGCSATPMHKNEYHYPSYLQKGKFDAVLLCDLGLTRLTKTSGILINLQEQLKELIHLKNESLKVLDIMSSAPVGRSRNKILIIHNFIPHTPVYFTKNGMVHTDTKHDLPGPYMEETAFFMERISQLLQHLRNLKIYDEALIIVAGDHGHFVGIQEGLYTAYPGAEDFDGYEFGIWARGACMYNPAILIKPPRSSKSLVISRKPLCLTNLRQIINAYFDNDFVSFSKNLTYTSFSKDPKKIVVFREGCKSNPYESAEDHVVLENRANASMLPRLFLSPLPQDVVDYRLGATLSPPNKLMISKAWNKESGCAWLQNRAGILLFKPVGFNKEGYTIKIRATPLVNKDHPSQHVRVMANGFNLGELTATASMQDLYIPLPGDVVKQNSDRLLIEFIPQNAVSPKELGLWDYPGAISIFIHSFAII